MSKEDETQTKALRTCFYANSLFVSFVRFSTSFPFLVRLGMLFIPRGD